ncbi:Ribosomal protein S20 [Spironucleus salmonicida]|uniref:Ribosomal protein S20 n=1 Tax=Spironucleus salmonicida TaxID=348837 RepID=V6M0I4_9EUKA|nr:Ribosomal protein S20 [Spironucleus salmonicida]|eukprot:EST46644.1 Ribosomal protein S20 [Spironucleus salmonicida]
MAEDKKVSQTLTYKLVLVAKDLPLVENFCRKLKQSTEGCNVKISGATRLPVKRLAITTRKSPCGNGSNTWDRYELRLYKRTFNVTSSPEELQELFKTCKNPAGVQLTIQQIE